jgi:hypothetical protein
MASDLKLNEILPDNQTELTLENLFGPYNKSESLANNLISVINGSSFLSKALKLSLDIAGGLVVIMILWAAFLYVTAYGEESKIDQAKKTMNFAWIGIVIVGFAQFMILLAKELSTK